MKKNEYAQAVMQLIGFRHGKDGYDFTSLLEAMGLKKDEWEKLKKEEAGLLTDRDIEDGDALFANI